MRDLILKNAQFSEFLTFSVTDNAYATFPQKTIFVQHSHGCQREQYRRKHLQVVTAAYKCFRGKRLSRGGKSGILCAW
jgi:hypothetical protein